MVKATPDFVHLHLHSWYSLLCSSIRPDQLFERAKELGMASVALTDHGSLYGAMEFYKAAESSGIKPIIGYEAYVTKGKMTDRSLENNRNPFHLVLLAKNDTGYKNLVQLSTLSYTQGLFYKPRIDKEVISQFSEGLICLSACLAGEIPRLIQDGKINEAEATAQFYQSVFGEDHFYLEVLDNGRPDQTLTNEVLFDMSKRLSIPLVATNDCHYLNKQNVRTHEILLCIQTGQALDDPKRFTLNTDQLYFKSKEEMAASFLSHPESLANTVDIARRCQVEYESITRHIPMPENKPEALTTKVVVTHVARTLNIPLPDIYKITVLIPEGMTLNHAIQDKPRLAEYAKSKEYGELISICNELDGQPGYSTW